MISSLHLRSFRSFEVFNLEIVNPLLLIEGVNGTGKTSLLEALYYTCYLKSFRTHLQKELLNIAHDAFFIKIKLTGNDTNHVVQVGFSHAKRIVKIDDKPIQSYKQLLSYYRVVSITEEDLDLIKGSPEIRRSFLDQAIVLANPDYVQDLKKFRVVLDHRNSTLRTFPLNQELYQIWTEQFIEISRTLQAHRIKFLECLSSEVNVLFRAHFDHPLSIKFSYRNKKIDLAQKNEVLWPKIKELSSEESKYGRSCFGAHLDDFEIIFQDMNSRIFASRGQQKLLLFLIKIAQTRLLLQHGERSTILIDDFMTDFDENRIKILFSILIATQNQLIVTSPYVPSPLRSLLEPYGPQVLKLTV